MLWEILDRGESDAPAVVVPGGPRLTYGQLREEVRRGAGALAGLGLRRDQAIGMVFENGPEAIVLFLAAAAVTAAAPLNPAYTEAELRFYLDDVDAGALIVPPGGAAAARAARPEGAVLVEAAVGGDGRLSIEAAGQSLVPAPLDEPGGGDVALMLHTSGTTGRPSGSRCGTGTSPPRSPTSWPPTGSARPTSPSAPCPSSTSTACWRRRCRRWRPAARWWYRRRSTRSASGG